MRGTQFAYGCAHAAKIERGCYVRSLKPESVYWPGNALRAHARDAAIYCSLMPAARTISA
jgi:hypothetical protein